MEKNRKKTLIITLLVSTALAVLLVVSRKYGRGPALPEALDPALFAEDPSLPVPEGVWVRPGFEGGAELLWEAQEGEGFSYQAQIGTEPSFEDSFVCDAGQGPSFQIRGLKEGESYYFRLRTLGQDSRCSGWGETLGQTAAGGKEDRSLAPPYDGIYVRDQEEGISILWKKLEGFDTYEVYRSETGKDSWVLADANAASQGVRRVTWTDPAEPGEGSCYYLVRTCMGEGKERTCSLFGSRITASFQPLTLSAAEAAIPAGETRTFEAWYGWGGGQGLKWSSNAPAIASVDQKGSVRGVRPGTARITASLPDGSQKAVLTVYVDRQAPPMGELPESAYVYDQAEGIFRRKEEDKDGRAVILIAGDLMSIRRQMNAVRRGNDYDFYPSFSLIRKTLEEADLTAGNLETLTAPAWSYNNEEPAAGGKTVCNTSPRYLEALRTAGFDLLTLSNNHNADWGQQAAGDTVENAERYGFLHTGLFRDASEERTLTVEVSGIRIGFLAYTGGGLHFNGKDRDWPEEDRETILNAYSQERARKDMEALRQKGAEYIIVCMHWGIVNEQEVTQEQRETARELADLGADFVAGSHAHLVQAFEVLTASDGRQVPCIYSMGNFMSDLVSLPGQRDSVLMRLVLERDETGRAVLAEKTYIPCHTYDEISGIPYATLALTEENSALLPPDWEKSRDYIRESMGDGIGEYDGM